MEIPVEGSIMCRKLHGTGRKSSLVVSLGALLMALPGLCRAQTTITVNSLLDSSDSGKCTLRDAINIAQGSSASPDDSCTTSGSGSPYTIKFIVTGTITLESALNLFTNTPLTIVGPTTAPGITIDGASDTTIMVIGSGATVYLEDRELSATLHEIQST